MGTQTGTHLFLPLPPLHRPCFCVLARKNRFAISTKGRSTLAWELPGEISARQSTFRVDTQRCPVFFAATPPSDTAPCDLSYGIQFAFLTKQRSPLASNLVGKISSHSKPSGCYRFHSSLQALKHKLGFIGELAQIKAIKKFCGAFSKAPQNFLIALASANIVRDKSKFETINYHSSLLTPIKIYIIIILNKNAN